MQLQRFRAIVDNVSTDIIRTGKKTYRMLVLIKPSPKDEMGDSLFKDDVFNVLVVENRIPLVQDLKKGDKVSVDIILTGQRWMDAKSHEQISLTLKLYRLEKIAQNQPVTDK
jgi:hypothetical protein